MSHDLRCVRGVTAYAVNISIIVSDEGRLHCVENAIKRYKIVEEANDNQVKSVGSQFRTWTGKSM